MKIFIIILLLLIICSNDKKYDKSALNPVDSVTIEEIKKEQFSFFIQVYINIKEFLFKYMPFVKGTFRSAYINFGGFFGFYYATAIIIIAYLGILFLSWTVLALLFYLLLNCNLCIFGRYPFKHKKFTIFMFLLKNFLTFIAKSRSLNNYDDENILINQFFFVFIMILLFAIPFMPLPVLIYYLLKWLNKKYNFIQVKKMS